MHIIVGKNKLRSGPSGAWVELSLGNYGKQIFSFFQPIVHFNINVAALSTFIRHVPACETPVRVSDGSILPIL